MAHFLSEVTHLKLGQRPEYEEQDYEPLLKAPTSSEFDGFIRAMEVSTVTTEDDSKNGVKVWTADQQGTISVRDIKGDVSHVVERKKEVHVAALLAHGPYMWVGLSDGYLRIFDQKTYELCFERKQHSGRITCMVSVGPDVYTGSDDWQIYKWAAKTFEPTRQLSGHQCSVLCLAHDGGDVLFSGSEDFTIRCWDLERGLEKLGQGWPARNHSDGVTALVICEVHLFSGSRDGTVKVWNTTTGAMIKFLDRRDGPITTLMKDPTSQRIWAGGTDGVISLYDAFSLRLVTRLRDHTNTYVKHLGVVVRLSSLKVWSANEDGVVKVWYADEDNEYSVYEERSNQLQGTVEDMRAQLIDNFNKITENKAHHKRLVDIDDRRKVNMAAGLGRKGNLSVESAYYNRVVQWIMKRREEKKCRDVASCLQEVNNVALVRTAYHKLQLYSREQRERRRKANMSLLLANQTKKGLSTAYWRNLLDFVRKEQLKAQRGDLAGDLEKYATATTCNVYYLRWLRFIRRARELRRRPAIAANLGRASERQQAVIFWKKLQDFAVREKENAKKRRAVASILQHTEWASRYYAWHKLRENVTDAHSRRLRERRSELLTNENEKANLRAHFHLLQEHARNNSVKLLAQEQEREEAKNKDLETILSMQEQYTDEQIDRELAELEAELAVILEDTAVKRGDKNSCIQEQMDTRRNLAKSAVKVNADATTQEQLAEVMLMLKGKAIDCGADFEHLTEARDEGKKVGPSKMYDAGLKQVRKVSVAEATRKAKEVGVDVPRELIAQDGEWFMVDSVDSWQKKSVRSAAAGIKDMIIAYDMMTINPAALSKASHNKETVANSGLMLDVVRRYFGLRKAKEEKDERRSKKSSKKKSSKKRKSSKKKSGKKVSKKKAVKPAEEGEERVATRDLAAPKKVSKKKTSKKKVSKKKSSKKSGSLTKTSKKKVSKKKSTKKSTKKSGLKKKSTKKSTKKKSKKKSTKKRTGLKKKSLKKKSTKKKTGLKKKSLRKKKVAKKPATSALNVAAKKREVDPAKKPWLGMMIQVDVPDRVIVNNVAQNGPAALAGFGDDDVLVNFGGAVVTDVASFQAAFKVHAKPNAEVSVRALHNGLEDQPFETVLKVGSVADKLSLATEWVAGAATLGDAEARAEVNEDRIEDERAADVE